MPSPISPPLGTGSLLYDIWQGSARYVNGAMQTALSNYTASLAVIGGFIALTTLYYSAAALVVGQLDFSFPAAAIQGYSVLAPTNLPACLTAIVAAKTLSAGYLFKLRVMRSAAIRQTMPPPIS